MSDDIEALIDNLDEGNWFDLLAVLNDALLEANENAKAEAVRWLLKHRREPFTEYAAYFSSTPGCSDSTDVPGKWFYHIFNQGENSRTHAEELRKFFAACADLGTPPDPSTDPGYQDSMFTFEEAAS